MKRVDPKKLLPSSVSAGGSVGAVSPNILVPVSNITAKTYAKVEPEENTPQKSQLRAQTFQIKSKLIEVSNLFSVKNKFTRDKNRKKRIEEERKRREQREKESEKTTFNFGSKLPKLVLPRTGFLDSIKRFLLYSLLGFAVEKFLPLVPKLLEFGKMLVPAVQFLTDFAGNFLVNMVNFIDRGYKVYDGIKEQLDRIIPSDISQQFSKFSGLLNAALNAALLFGTAAIGLGGPLGSKIGGKGVAAAAAAAGAIGTALATRGRAGVPAIKSLTSTPIKAKIKNLRDSAIERANRRVSLVEKRSLQKEISRASQEKKQKPVKVRKKSINVGDLVATGYEVGVGGKPNVTPKDKGILNRLTKENDPKKIQELTNNLSGERQVRKRTTRLSKTADAEGVKLLGRGFARKEITPSDFNFIEKVSRIIANEKNPKIKEELEKGLNNFAQNPRSQNSLRFKNSIEIDRIIPKPPKITAEKLKPKASGVSKTQAVSKGFSKFKLGKFRKAGPGIFGALLDIGISLALGEPLDRALVSAAGAGVGGWFGGVAGSVVPGIGTIIGATLGSILGSIGSLALYDTLSKRKPRTDIMKKPKEKPGEKLKREKKLESLEGGKAPGGLFPPLDAPPPPYVPSGVLFSIENLVRLALSVGFKKENAAIAAAIAMAESTGNSKAHNTKYPDDSYGLWQINMIDRPGYMLGEDRRKRFNIKDNTELFDPTFNAKIAYKLSGGYNFSAWTTYTGGAYKTYLRAAQEAFQKISSRSTGPVIPKPQSSLPPLPPTNTVHGQQYGADRGGRRHAGVDFDISGNETFYSRIGGQVIGIYNDPGGYGNYVDIYNKDLNVTERIAEGAVVLVSVGDIIQPGDAVVRGETSTGVIHYEIRKGKSGAGGGFTGTLNPINFLNNLPKKKASIDKPFTKNVAKGLNTQTGYEGYQVAILPIKQIIEKPVPMGGSGGRRGGGIDIDINRSQALSFASAVA